MTSDELFWRLVLVSRSVDEAVLLWWLASVRADERPYRAPPRTMERLFGLDRRAVFRVRSELEVDGVVATRVLANRYTDYTLAAHIVNQRLARMGQFATVPSTKPLSLFDPFSSDGIVGAPFATACARLCVLLGSREEAILLAWLYQAGATAGPVRASGRDMRFSLGGLLDRRTAMRALVRLEMTGLLTVTPLGRVGTEYRLDGDALLALLSCCPLRKEAAAVTPGWSSTTFPLLQRLAALDAEATSVAHEARLEV